MRDQFRKAPKRVPVAPLAPSEHPLFAALDPRGFRDATTPAGTGARLQIGLEDDELEAANAAARAEEQRRLEAARRRARAERMAQTTSMDEMARDALVMGLGRDEGERIHSSVDQFIPDFEYAPDVFAGNLLDAVTLGNAAEVGGGIRSLRDDTSYRDEEQDLRAALGRASELRPRSALLGNVAGGALLAPLLPGATGARGLDLARRAAVPALVGGGIGTVAGALGADEGDRIGGALRGGLTGTLAGGTLGLGGVGGAEIRALGATRGFFPRLGYTTLASGLEGLGVAGGMAPGLSEDPVSDIGSAAETFGEFAPEAVIGGAILGGGAETLGSSMRALGAISRFGRTGPGRLDETMRLPTRRNDVPDETLLLSGAEGDGTMAFVPDTQTMLPGETPAEFVQRMRAESPIRDESPIEAAVRDAITRPIPETRLLSMGMRGPGSTKLLRGGANAFRGTQPWVDSLQEAGLARPASVYSNSLERERALQLRDASGQSLVEHQNAMLETNPPVFGADIVPPIDREAAFWSRSSDPRSRRTSDYLRRRSNDFQWIGGDPPQNNLWIVEDTSNPVAVTGIEGGERGRFPRLSDAGEAYPLIEQEIMEGGFPRVMGYDEVIGELRPSSLLNKEAFAAPNQTELSPEARGGLAIHRGLVGGRNTAEAYTLSQPELDRVRGLRRAFGATQALLPSEQRLDPNIIRSPANLRAVVASAGEGLAGRARATLQERLIDSYADSVIASFNEVGLPTQAEAARSAARAVAGAIPEPLRSTREFAQIRAAANSGNAIGVRAAMERVRALDPAMSPHIDHALGVMDNIDQWPGIVRAIAMVARFAPERFGRLAQVLTEAARQGNFDQALWNYRNEPEVKAAIAASLDDARVMSEQHDADVERSVRENRERLMRTYAPQSAPAEATEANPIDSGAQEIVDENRARLRARFGGR